jgi:hypothetical protein
LRGIVVIAHELIRTVVEDGRLGQPPGSAPAPRPARVGPAQNLDFTRLSRSARPLQGGKAR